MTANNVGCRLNKEDYEEFVEMAEEEGKSQSEFLRDVIAFYSENKEHEVIPSVISGSKGVNSESGNSDSDNSELSSDNALGEIMKKLENGNSVDDSEKEYVKHLLGIDESSSEEGYGWLTIEEAKEMAELSETIQKLDWLEENGVTHIYPGESFEDTGIYPATLVDY